MGILVLILMIASPITGGRAEKIKRLSLAEIKGKLPMAEYFHKGTPPLASLSSSEDNVRNYLKFQRNNPAARLKLARVKNLKEVKISYARILASRLTVNKIKEARSEVKEALKKGASQKEIVKLKLKKEKEICEGRLEIMRNLGNQQEYQREKEAYQKFMKLHERLQKTLEDR